MAEDLAQELHDRARRASEEVHNRLITFSAATLAAYFLALTGKESSNSTWTQTVLCLAGIGSMGLAVFAGLFGLYADTKRNYYRACSLQATEPAKVAAFTRRHDTWLARQRTARPTLVACFSVGVVASIAYLCTRIDGPARSGSPPQTQVTHR
jgi:hypothetical protein